MQAQCECVQAEHFDPKRGRGMREPNRKMIAKLARRHNDVNRCGQQTRLGARRIHLLAHRCQQGCFGSLGTSRKQEIGHAGKPTRSLGEAETKPLAPGSKA